MYRLMYNSDVRYVSNRDGVYYYTRRVPYDVKKHYASDRLSFSLKTKSYANAVRAAQSVTQRLEDYWLGLRLQQMDIPAIHLVKTDDVEYTSPVMLDAVDMYLSIKGNNDRIFVRTARRNSEYVAKVLGNRPITSYSTLDAAKFRDWCFEKSMNINTVKRVFASVRSIINLVMKEHGIEGKNAFSGTFMPDRDDVTRRKPIPNDVLKHIQQRCMEANDDPRWLVALISDTGMRLSEAAGLAVEDIHLNEEIPYVDISQHPWRRLKTPSSQRKLPLVGCSLWGAQQAVHASTSPYLFPRYCDGEMEREGFQIKLSDYFFNSRCSRTPSINSSADTSFSKQFEMFDIRLSIVEAGKPISLIAVLNPAIVNVRRLFPSSYSSLMRRVAMQSEMLSFIICAGLFRGGCGKSMSPIW